MSVPVDFEAVLLSSDSDVLGTIAESLMQSGIKPVIFHDSSLANEYIFRKKVDALIVDSEVDRAISVLQSVRSTPSNWTAPTFAITAFQGGSELFGLAHFTIEKPLDRNHFDRALRVAYAKMMQERRRYYRHPVRLPVSISRSTFEAAFKGSTVNLSENGVALQCEAPLVKREIVNIQFRIPALHGCISCQGEIIWADSRGLGGLRFIAMSRSERQIMRAWLSEEFKRRNPIRAQP